MYKSFCCLLSESNKRLLGFNSFRRKAGGKCDVESVKLVGS